MDIFLEMKKIPLSLLLIHQVNYESIKGILSIGIYDLRVDKGYGDCLTFEGLL